MQQMVRRFILLLLAVANLAAHAAADNLPQPVLQALKAANIPTQAVAVVVQALDAPQPTLRHQANVPMNPASLAKLTTTLAALEILGPAYVWRTEVLADAAPGQEGETGGVLNGNLYLRGSGDPKLTHDRLWLLLRELRARGVREIRGDLVLDHGAFAPVAHDPSAFDSKPLRPYNVGPDALLFNFATLHLTLVPPDTPGGAVKLLAEPLPADFTIINRLKPSEAKTCGEWREALTAQFAPNQLTLSGNFPHICGEKRWHLAGLPNDVLLQGVFTRLWRELGGAFNGKARAGNTPETAVPLAVSESPALAELVRDINKYSNNVMARQLFLTLGAGDTAQAETTIRGWLAKKGLDFPELVLDNGAGLSRTARISAGSLARLLQAGWASPMMPEYLASLPIAAIDGTVKRKFKENGVAGQAHLKTGSLEGVRGIAGYLNDRAGKRFLVVFMVNHPNAGQAQPAFDALLERVWQGGEVKNQTP